MADPLTLNLRKFGWVVRAERERLNVSQEKFAEMCGVDRTFIGQVERGEVNLSLKNMLRIADALGVRVYYLFKQADI